MLNGGAGGTDSSDDTKNPENPASFAISDTVKGQIDAINAAIKTPSGKTQWTDGGASPAKQVIDLSNLKFDADGTVTVTLGGKSFDVDVKKDMTGTQFAAALKTVYDASSDKIPDKNSGTFTLDDKKDGTIELVASGNTAFTTNPFEDFNIVASKTQKNAGDFPVGLALEADTKNQKPGQTLTVGGNLKEAGVDFTDSGTITASELANKTVSVTYNDQTYTVTLTEEEDTGDNTKLKITNSMILFRYQLTIG